MQTRGKNVYICELGVSSDHSEKVNFLQKSVDSVLEVFFTTGAGGD